MGGKRGDGLDDLEEIGDVSPQVPVKTKGGGSTMVVINDD
jgi:hypothetical protein